MGNRKKKLKALKKAGHKYVDILWLYKHYHSGKSYLFWRKKAYKWLAKKMELSTDECHFNKFTAEQCIKAIDICANEFASNDNMIEFAEKIENGEIHKLQWFTKKYNNWYGA